MPWELNKVEVQRKNLIDAYVDGTLSMTELCKFYQISRKTAYKWLNRYYQQGAVESSLCDQSRAPINPYRNFDHVLIELAIEQKLKHRTWGPRKILAKLEREFPKVKWPSPTRLYEILKANHLVTPRRLRGRVPATHPLGQLNDANDIWTADFKGWFLTADNAKCEPLTIADAHSRFLIKCEHVDRKTADCIWPIYKDAFLEFGLPNRLRTDNGPPFASIGAGRLTSLGVNLIKAGVTPEWINPGHPEENGRHERIHLTLKQSVANPPAKDITEQKFWLKKFQQEYNFDRPHESLGMQTPGDFYSKSTRSWDGILRSPEYDASYKFVRKVGTGGGVTVKQRMYYISSALTDEYIGIKEDDDNLNIYYGPVFLGRLIPDVGLEKPKLVPKPIIRRG